jgi:hypothetical protein
VQLPAFLVRVIDPAEGYFENRRPRRPGRPVYRGGALFGPAVPGGSRQATDEEIQAMRRRVSELPAPPRRELTSAQRDEVAAAVTSLLDTGHAAIGEGPRRAEAQIVKFWHGDSILEVGRGSGSTLTRIARRPTAHDRKELFSLLARQLELTAE